MIANVFTSQKHQNFLFFCKADQKQMWRLKAKKKEVMRQAGFLGDSYNSKTTPFKYATIKTTFLKSLWEMFRASPKLI